MNFNYPEMLPVSQKRKEILDALRANQVTIVAGDTGSGKTTQLPKMCLELLQHTSGIVGCTQPRRVAAMSVCQRVSEELAEHSHLVGYKVRFHNRTTGKTRIMFMTDGVLLAETRHDYLLKKYDFLIIDEAHERSLNIDFLIGHLKNILTKRPDLKVIVTSATIDTDAFVSHFNNAPVITIPGKVFPVEIRYAPTHTDDSDESANYLEKSIEAVTDIHMKEPPGDILIFLPTEKDIRTCCELLQQKITNAVILPLFGRLHSADQRKIFEPMAITKIVVATNVAETSITVPGIRYVVDTGLARMAVYNGRSKTHSIPIRKISRASCDQRKGRCGRSGPGVCVRLFSEEDFLQREEFTLPEIQRSNLSEVILQMLSFGLGDPFTFPFIEPLRPSAIKEGYRSLFELGAINKHKKLTEIGKTMASLPIDSAIARIIVAAQHYGCLREITVIATVLAVQDPRIRPVGFEKKADRVHQQFIHPHSDFLTFINIWNLLHHRVKKTSWSRLKKFCNTYYLSFQRMREWLDLHEQMTKILQKHKQFKRNSQEAVYESIHKSLAVGFLRNIGLRKSKNVYQGSSGKEVMIFPGSGQFNKNPQWLLASTFLETTRLYALNVALIEPNWLEELAGKLCKYSWSAPRYQKKSGQIIADEKVTLFGLVIVPSRQVNFAHTTVANQKEARKIFIQSALIEGQLSTNHHFLLHNRKLIGKWDKIESRLRARDILVNEQAIFDFYDTHLPDAVFDLSSLNKFLRKSPQENLFLQENDVVNRKPPGHELADFPKALTLAGNDFPLHYVFDPTSADDGVSITIPHDIAEHIDSNIFDWTVPGLLREKTLFLLKTLPKRIRKHLIPLSITVDNILDDITLYKGSYFKALEKSILKRFKLTVRRSDWSKQLPTHLLMNINLVDKLGKKVAASRDFTELMRSIDRQRSQVTSAEKLWLPEEVKQWQEHSSKKWDFENLPTRVPLTTDSGEITGYLYPAIVPNLEKSQVTVTFFHHEAVASEHNRQGMQYLYRLFYSRQYTTLKKSCNTALSGPSSLWFVALFTSKPAAVDALLEFILDTLFKTHENGIPSKKRFQERLDAVKAADFFRHGSRICDGVLALLRQRNEVMSEINRFAMLAKKTNTYVEQRYIDYTQALAEILPKDFLQTYTFAEFDDLNRYMKSLIVRVNRAYSNAEKDKKKADIIGPYIHKLDSIKKTKNNLSQECREKIMEFAQHIQEFHISLFSPELKTKFPVSAKKLQTIWQEIEQEC